MSKLAKRNRQIRDMRKQLRKMVKYLNEGKPLPASLGRWIAKQIRKI